MKRAWSNRATAANNFAKFANVAEFAQTRAVAADAVGALLRTHRGARTTGAVGPEVIQIAYIAVPEIPNAAHTRRAKLARSALAMATANGVISAYGACLRAVGSGVPAIASTGSIPSEIITANTLKVAHAPTV